MVRVSKEGTDIEKKIRSSPSSSELLNIRCEMPKKPYKKGQVELALSMFYKLLQASASDEFVVVDCLTCNELLVALRKSDKREEFQTVFELLREREGFCFDTWGYNICIHAFGCWGDLQTSLKLFKKMKEKGTGFGPDLCTYNSLIHVLCTVGKVKNALIVWEELKTSGHEPDVFSFRIIIQGCCKLYRVNDAEKIFSEMQYNGFRPDTVVYNSLLDGMFKVRKLKEACQLFETMIEDGVRASCRSYNILIDGLFRNRRAVAAYTLFCDLKKKGQFVDGVTYSIVILHLCREGHLKGALELVDEMEARGFVVDLVTITSLLKGLHKHGRWDWAEQLMKHVRDNSLVVNALMWKAQMEAKMNGPQDKSKDFTPIFPSKGDFGEMFAFQNDPTTPKNVVIPPYQKLLKSSVRPPLIPTEDDQEKQEEGFVVSLGRLVLNAGSAMTEILGGLFSFRKKTISNKNQYSYQQQQRRPNVWPVQDSFVIPDEDEPPSLETRTPPPRKTYAFMAKESERTNPFRQSRAYYNGWDGDYQQQQQQLQQHQHQQHHQRHYSSGPQTYYEQSCESTNEIVFGAVQFVFN